MKGRDTPEGTDHARGFYLLEGHPLKAEPGERTSPFSGSIVFAVRAPAVKLNQIFCSTSFTTQRILGGCITTC